MKFLASITSYRTSFSPFLHLYQVSSPSLSACGCTSRVSGEQRFQHAQGPLSSNHAQSHFQITTFCTFICWPILSLGYLFLFTVMWVCLSLENREATELHVLLPISELSNRCTGTNHQQTWREVMRWWKMMCICRLCSDLWTEEPRSKVCALYNYSQLIYHDGSNLNSVVGEAGVI